MFDTVTVSVSIDAFYTILSVFNYLLSTRTIYLSIYVCISGLIFCLFVCILCTLFLLLYYIQPLVPVDDMTTTAIRRRVAWYANLYGQQQPLVTL